MKIGFFDSGIGGLTVFKEALRCFPNEEYIYFADSENAPYGSKSEEEVRELILDAVDFLANKGIDVLIIACHTASALMTEELSHLYGFPIIPMCSGLPQSNKIASGKKVLIAATDLSVQVLEKKINYNATQSDFVSLQNLIVFAEKFEFHSSDVLNYLETKLARFNWQNYHAIVLGCTHFPFFKYQIKALIPDSVRVLDGSLSTVLQLPIALPSDKFQEKKSIDYYISKEREASIYFNKYLDKLDLKGEFHLKQLQTRLMYGRRATSMFKFSIQ